MPDASDHSPCRPLGLGSEAFIARAKSELGLARPAALDAYKDFFWHARPFDAANYPSRHNRHQRALGASGGSDSLPEPNQPSLCATGSTGHAVAPISNVIIDEGPEGKTFKFTQDVPADATKLAEQVKTLRTESVLI
ncbi:MAG: hypothetical protein ACK58T_28295, partial [Phycisphaerae bacterium]